jgi:hypothetical protein
LRLCIRLDRVVSLGTLGNQINLPLLLTHSNPYLITFVLAIKKNNDEKKETVLRTLYDHYMTDSIGNVNYFEYVINLGVTNDLLEM